MPRFTTTRRVQFAETDMAGIVHFANFYRWMEEAEHEFFRSLGLSVLERRTDGSIIGWPRVSASCSFERPAFYGDVLEVHLDIERIGVKSLTFDVVFWKGDTRIAYGRMKTACCLCGVEGTLESIDIPENDRRALSEEGPE